MQTGCSMLYDEMMETTMALLDYEFQKVHDFTPIQLLSSTLQMGQRPEMWLEIDTPAHVFLTGTIKSHLSTSTTPRDLLRTTYTLISKQVLKIHRFPKWRL